MQNHYMVQYGMAGAVGGAVGGMIGAALSDAIYGSAERRRLKRLNLRNCMHFKGYDRSGLSKELWVEFNFEEGNGRKPEAERERAIAARVAAGQTARHQLGLVACDERLIERDAIAHADTTAESPTVRGSETPAPRTS